MLFPYHRCIAILACRDCRDAEMILKNNALLLPRKVILLYWSTFTITGKALKKHIYNIYLTKMSKPIAFKESHKFKTFTHIF